MCFLKVIYRWLMPSLSAEHNLFHSIIIIKPAYLLFTVLLQKYLLLLVSA